MGCTSIKTARDFAPHSNLKGVARARDGDEPRAAMPRKFVPPIPVAQSSFTARTPTSRQRVRLIARDRSLAPRSKSNAQAALGDSFTVLMRQFITPNFFSVCLAAKEK